MSEKITLSVPDIMAIEDEKDFIIDGETYRFREKSEEEIDDNGKYTDFIYQRDSDGEYFKAFIFWTRYGYECYDFDPSICDREMVNVKKVRVTVERWEAV